MELERALELWESGEYFPKASPGMVCGYVMVQIVDVDPKHKCQDGTVGTAAFQAMKNFSGTKFTTTRIPLSWLTEYTPTKKRKRTRKVNEVETKEPRKRQKKKRKRKI